MVGVGVGVGVGPGVGAGTAVGTGIGTAVGNSTGCGVAVGAGVGVGIAAAGQNGSRGFAKFGRALVAVRSMTTRYLPVYPGLELDTER